MLQAVDIFRSERVSYQIHTSFSSGLIDVLCAFDISFVLPEHMLLIFTFSDNSDLINVGLQQDGGSRYSKLP